MVEYTHQIKSNKAQDLIKKNIENLSILLPNCLSGQRIEYQRLVFSALLINSSRPNLSERINIRLGWKGVIRMPTGNCELLARFIGEKAFNVRVTLTEKAEEGAWIELLRDGIGGGILHNANKFAVVVRTPEAEVKFVSLGCDLIQSCLSVLVKAEIVRFDITPWPIANKAQGRKVRSWVFARKVNSGRFGIRYRIYCSDFAEHDSNGWLEDIKKFNSYQEAEDYANSWTVNKCCSLSFEVFEL